MMGICSSQRNPHRLLPKLIAMLFHLVGLLVRVFNSQVTGIKSLQVDVLPGRTVGVTIGIVPTSR